MADLQNRSTRFLAEDLHPAHLRVVGSPEEESLETYYDMLATERNNRAIRHVMKWVIGIVVGVIIVFAVIQVTVVKFSVPSLNDIKVENKQLAEQIGQIVRENSPEKVTVEAKVDPNSASLIQDAVRGEVKNFGLEIAKDSPIVKKLELEKKKLASVNQTLASENIKLKKRLATEQGEKDLAVQKAAIAEKQLSDGPEVDWMRLTPKQKFAIWAAEQLGFNESTWRYDIVGPDVYVPIEWKKDPNTGKYLRDKKTGKRIPTKWKVLNAYGYYQVLKPNVGPWSKRFCGVELTPKQFLKNPECQDLVALRMMDELHDTCKGTKVQKAACIARIWFAGPGGAPLDADDGQTTVREYLDNMTKRHALKG